jgi:hypothetical protein
MNSPYGSLNNGEEWIDPGWCDWPAAGISYDEFDAMHFEDFNVDTMTHPYTTQDISESALWTDQTTTGYGARLDSTTSTTDNGQTTASLFSTALGAKVDPPYASHDQGIQRQRPRFDGDVYTASWVRGEGHERAGWCGFCSTWHKMRDSAFWYHMHYSHGKHDFACKSSRHLTSRQQASLAQPANLSDLLKLYRRVTKRMACESSVLRAKSGWLWAPAPRHEQAIIDTPTSANSKRLMVDRARDAAEDPKLRSFTFNTPTYGFS